MNIDVSQFIQFTFSLLFIATLLAGVYLLRNSERLFGIDPSVPSETSSGRAYGKMQAFAVWAHAAALTGAFALLLH
jgi:hypothetical protein